MQTLFELRDSKGYSASEVAKKLGLTPQAIRNWEKGLNYPQTQNIRGLSNFFGVSLDEMRQILEETQKRPDTSQD